jgi:ABC-2 type transport system permease protein
VVSSQVLYRVILALFQTVVIILLARFVFHVNMVGSWFMLILMVVVGTLTFVSIGYLAVSRAKTTESAMPVVQLIQFPMLFLSGVFFPVEIMPSFMKPIVAVMPLSYLGDGLRQIMVAATPQHPIVIDLAVLGLWFVATSLLTIRIFKWE